MSYDKYTAEPYRCNTKYCKFRGPALLVNKCYEPHGEVTYGLRCADCGGKDIEPIFGSDPVSLTDCLRDIASTRVG